MQILNIFQGLLHYLLFSNSVFALLPPPCSLSLSISLFHRGLSVSPQKPWQPDHLCLLVSIKSEISAFVNISFVPGPWCTTDLSADSWHWRGNAEAAVSLIRPGAGTMMADTAGRLHSLPTWYYDTNLGTGLVCQSCHLPASHPVRESEGQMGGVDGAWGVGRRRIMYPTLRAMEGGTIMKFVCVANANICHSVWRMCGPWLTFECGDSSL